MNRKSTTSFPASYSWSAYVTPKSPKWWLKKLFFSFLIRFNFNRIKSAIHGFLRKNSQRQPFNLKSSLKVTHPFEKRQLRQISASNVSTVRDGEKFNYDE